MESFSPYLDKFYNPLMAGSIDGTDTEPHDRAISRALAASYKPNKFVKGDPSLTLFVARLSPKSDEVTLLNAFSQFGKIKQCRLVRDIVTGFSKCYGFIEFEDEKAVRLAHREGHKMEIDEQEVIVEHEFERTLKNWVPRRLGGGFGGKKESGQLRFGGRDRPFRKPIPVVPQWGKKGDGSPPQSRLHSRVSWRDESRHGERERDTHPGWSGREMDRYSSSRRRRGRSRSPHHDGYS
ncbi:hypothetical protein BaRGS_00016117 [Batillaria attramentaria]|uniref:U11/U12 small nuclear ribonucleoprotein 35 kDa protein n=1 Tax=Batillaria attramentaria TaxID=370345 RepID=A0ABD0KZG3_9CAEN